MMYWVLGIAMGLQIILVLLTIKAAKDAVDTEGDDPNGESMIDESKSN